MVPPKTVITVLINTIAKSTSKGIQGRSTIGTGVKFAAFVTMAQALRNWLPFTASPSDLFTRFSGSLLPHNPFGLERVLTFHKVVV